MPKKPNRKTLVKKLDKVVSEIVKARDKRCVVCGSIERLGCGHLFSRRNYSTRWDLSNCHAQCWPCNFRHEFDWEPYRAWFVKEYGQEEYDYLYDEYRSIKKWKNWELEELLEKYKQILEDIERG